MGGVERICLIMKQYGVFTEIQSTVVRKTVL